MGAAVSALCQLPLRCIGSFSRHHYPSAGKAVGFESGPGRMIPRCGLVTVAAIARRAAGSEERESPRPFAPFGPMSLLHDPRSAIDEHVGATTFSTVNDH